MKSLTEFGLKDDGNGGFKANSHIAGLAIELSYCLKSINPEVSLQLRELALSLLNLKNTSLLAYGRLALHHKKIIEESEELTRYSILPLLTEFTYNFIVIGKSSIDISACIVDIIENRTVRKEHELTDISKYTNNKNGNSKINKEFINLKNEPWFKELELIRNRILHRGVKIEYKYLDVHDQKHIRTKVLEKENISFFNQIKIIESEIFTPAIVVNMVKENFSWTGIESNIDYEWISDGRGKVKSKMDIELIANGLTTDYYHWDKKLTKLFITEGLVPEVTNYNKVHSTFTSVGSFLSHPRVGSF